jgi:hypothetical protein
LFDDSASGRTPRARQLPQDGRLRFPLWRPEDCERWLVPRSSPRLRVTLSAGLHGTPIIHPHLENSGARSPYLTGDSTGEHTQQTPMIEVVWSKIRGTAAEVASCRW